MRWINNIMRRCTLVAMLVPLAAFAQTAPTLNEVEQLVRQACPNNWQDPMASVDYDANQDIWNSDVGDKGHFVNYAFDYLKQADGNLNAESFNDPHAIIYECGGLKVAFYEMAKQAAQDLITAIDTSTSDADLDGVPDGVDACPNTAAGAAVSIQGCSDVQLDADGDGVSNEYDLCPMTAANDPVDIDGCALRLKDSDGDGINDLVDQCPDTASQDTPNSLGCAPEQIDSDEDGIPDYRDAYPRQSANQCTP